MRITDRVAASQARPSEVILPLADALLADQKLKPADLSAVTYGRGPGSFTGVRLGAAVAQGLALAHDLPIFAESSLAAMALRAPLGSKPLCVLDAGLGLFHWAFYELTSAGLRELSGERVSSAEELSSWASSCEPGWLPIGRDWQKLVDRSEQLARAVSCEISMVDPGAAEGLELTLGRLERSECQKFQDTLPVYPLGTSRWVKQSPKGEGTRSPGGCSAA